MAQRGVPDRGWLILAIVVATGFSVAERDRRSVEASDLTAPGNLDSMRRAIEVEMTRQHIPGLTVAIALDDQRWSEGFGVADLENDVPATAETVYRLASISKPITAVAVMQLADEGRLDLDAPIQRYVPSFPEKSHPVTARQLLAHLGGIRWYKGDEMNSTRHYGSLTQALSMFRDDPLEHEPGTKYLYSTYGYNLLGAAVEGASGEGFPDYLEAHIFKPAGMEHIRVDDAAAIIPHRAQGYRKTPKGELRNSALADTSNKIPGGGLCSTALDLVAFARAFQNDSLVPSSVVDEMLTRQETSDGTRLDYGLGWQISRRRDRKEVWHGGQQPRVSTVLYTRPDSDLAVALMCNLEGAQLLDLARQLADIVEGEPVEPSASF